MTRISRTPANSEPPLYRVRWKSTVNGRSGVGTKSFPRAEALALVEELNAEYPNIEHEAVAETDC